ncbi:MAG TPA: M20/M25/M40 family metallo-hydrolase [Verrucomicrobiae bacterium]|nr:M20/M25/M40 family metallo-hydrolase [Verrucomicrobiae bacterium]
MIPHCRVLRPALLLPLLAAAPFLCAQESSSTKAPTDPIARIRDEGLNRSQVMKTVSYLTDVIGPRLTGSPGMKRANEWTRDQLASWGLTNAQLEPWGPFGRGWSLKHFSAQLLSPRVMPLIGVPKAWSPGVDYPIVGDVVYVEASKESDLDKYKGKLKGAIILTAPPHELKPRFEPMATRISETNLLRLANAGEPGPRSPPPSEIERPPRTLSTNTSTATSTNTPPRTNAPPGFSRGGFSRTPFFMIEGAAMLVTPSYAGFGGSVFADSAVVPTGGTATNLTGRSGWSTNAPPFLPQIALNAEHYNLLVRLAQRGEKLRAQIELQAQYHTDDLMAYNTVAEIPGSDLKDELVMLGGHMDSWHGGTGATDNGAGVAVCMEAVRILQAAGLHPRRTIRIALWSGEEQGLLGSRAYVTKHFGYYTNVTGDQRLAARAESPRSREQSEERLRQTSSSRRPERKLVPGPEHENFSAYFNLDNGAGKIRGIYLQGNEATRPIFRRWMAPFADLGTETLTLSNTGGTDHQSFDGAGLPGFQFIQDALDYWTLAHHSNMDTLERVVPEDLMQASVVMAAFVYQAAMADEKVPRKPERRTP